MGSIVEPEGATAILFDLDLAEIINDALRSSASDVEFALAAVVRGVDQGQV
jgi:hypothetical protein